MKNKILEKRKNFNSIVYFYFPELRGNNYFCLTFYEMLKYEEFNLNWGDQERDLTCVVVFEIESTESVHFLLYIRCRSSFVLSVFLRIVLLYHRALI